MPTPAWRCGYSAGCCMNTADAYGNTAGRAEGGSRTGSGSRDLNLCATVAQEGFSRGLMRS